MWRRTAVSTPLAPGVLPLKQSETTLTSTPSTTLTLTPSFRLKIQGLRSISVLHSLGQRRRLSLPPSHLSMRCPDPHQRRRFSLMFDLPLTYLQVRMLPIATGIFLITKCSSCFLNNRISAAFSWPVKNKKLLLLHQSSVRVLTVLLLRRRLRLKVCSVTSETVVKQEEINLLERSETPIRRSGLHLRRGHFSGARHHRHRLLDCKRNQLLAGQVIVCLEAQIPMHTQAIQHSLARLRAHQHPCVQVLRLILSLRKVYRLDMCPLQRHNRQECLEQHLHHISRGQLSDPRLHHRNLPDCRRHWPPTGQEIARLGALILIRTQLIRPSLGRLPANMCLCLRLEPNLRRATQLRMRRRKRLTLGTRNMPELCRIPKRPKTALQILPLRSLTRSSSRVRGR